MVAALFSLVLLVVLVTWATDRVTLQGERVMYSVRCAGGQWQQLTCTGRLEPGERYAFRASPRRQEVIAWTIGSALPSRTYLGCDVQSRDRWTCPVQTSEGSAAMLRMSKGRTQCAPASRATPAHVISKWKWYVLRAGLPLFSNAKALAQATCGPAN